MTLAQYSDTWWLPGGKLAACTLVKVYPVDSNIPADLYAGPCGSQRLPNPLRTSDRGVLSFWAEEGKYWLHIDGRTFPLTVGEAGCVAKGDLDQALGEHVQAGDPHGDRAAANAALMHHQATSRGVHGIVDTSNLETKDGAQCKAQEALETALTMVQQKVDQHAAQTRGVHGICDTEQLETIDGAQCKANAAVDAATLIVNERVEEHAARTTNVHGICDVTRLVTVDNVEPIVTAAAAPIVEEIAAPIARDAARPVAEEAAKKTVDEHAQKTTGVHGIADTAKLVTEEEVTPLAEKAAKPVAEEAAKKAVDEALEGLDIPDTSGLETKEGAQAKADKARDEAKAAAEECCKANADAVKAGDGKLQKQIDELKDGGTDPDPGGGVTEQRAKEIADEAAKKAGDGAKAAAEECCKANADAVKAGDGKLQKQIDELKDGGTDPDPGGKWETPAGAQAKADKAAEDAVAAHVKTCHTLGLVTGKKGVTPEKGWEVNLAERRDLGGAHDVFIRLTRTGDHLYSKGPDFQSDGLPSRGNIVPDLLIATVDKEWRPPQSYEVSAHTSYGSGSVRVQPDGKLYLLDWTYDNPLRTNHHLRIGYDWLAKSPCETGDGGGERPPEREEPQPDSEPGLSEADVEKIVDDRLAQYGSEYAQDNTKLTPPVEWTAMEPPVTVKLKAPPSLRVEITSCMEVRSAASGQGLLYQSVGVTKGEKVLQKPGYSGTIAFSASDLDKALDTSCTTYLLDLSGMDVKPGDEIVFTVHNKRAAASSSSSTKMTVESRNLTVESLPGARAKVSSDVPGNGVTRAEVTAALAEYPSGYAQSATPAEQGVSRAWSALAAGDGEVAVTVKVPPSRKVKVTTSMRASNAGEELSQVHQSAQISRGKDVVVKAGDFPVVTLSHVRLRETDAASRTFHVDFGKIADGAVEAGDEITVAVRNRVTAGKVKVLDRDVAVESLLA